MVAKTLAVIACLLLVSCQSMHARLTAARAVELSNTRLAASLPRELPENCTAEMAHVQPSAGTPWVSVQDRWMVLRENRNDQARACRTWWANYRSALSGEATRE